jgi:hypothetical protein
MEHYYTLLKNIEESDKILEKHPEFKKIYKQLVTCSDNKIIQQMITDINSRWGQRRKTRRLLRRLSWSHTKPINVAKELIKKFGIPQTNPNKGGYMTWTRNTLGDKTFWEKIQIKDMAVEHEHHGIKQFDFLYCWYRIKIPEEYLKKKYIIHDEYITDLDLVLGKVKDVGKKDKDILDIYKKGLTYENGLLKILSDSLVTSTAILYNITQIINGSIKLEHINVKHLYQQGKYVNWDKNTWETDYEFYKDMLSSKQKVTDTSVFSYRVKIRNFRWKNKYLKKTLKHLVSQLDYMDVFNNKRSGYARWDKKTLGTKGHIWEKVELRDEKIAHVTDIKHNDALYVYFDIGNISSMYKNIQSIFGIPIISYENPILCVRCESLKMVSVLLAYIKKIYSDGINVLSKKYYIKTYNVLTDEMRKSTTDMEYFDNIDTLKS